MKKRLFLLSASIALSTFIFAGCGDDGKGDSGGKDTGNGQITISNPDEKNQTLYADEIGGGVTFTAKQAWTATVTEKDAARSGEAPEWIWLDKSSGDAGTFTLTAMLAMNYSGAARSAEITIKSGDDEITITVTQNPTKENGQAPEIGIPAKGMRMVDRITYSYTYTSEWDNYSDSGEACFGYDDKGRTVMFTNKGTGETGEDYEISVPVTYNDADKSLTILFTSIDSWDNGGSNESESGDVTVEVEDWEMVCKLDENGWGISGSGKSEVTINDVRQPEKDAEYTFTMSYINGYLQATTYTGDYDYTSVLEWNGGNATKVTMTADNYGGSTTAQYNSSCPNNPMCNLDLNWLLYSDEYFASVSGFSGTPILGGFFGKRSVSMVSSLTSIDGSSIPTDNYVYEYDTEGFVKKVTVTGVPKDGVNASSVSVFNIYYK